MGGSEDGDGSRMLIIGDVVAAVARGVGCGGHDRTMRVRTKAMGGIFSRVDGLYIYHPPHSQFTVHVVSRLTGNSILELCGEWDSVICKCGHYACSIRLASAGFHSQWSSGGY